jgi:hypothetical protein
LGPLEVVDGKGIYGDDLDVEGGAYSQYLSGCFVLPQKKKK